LKEDSSVFSRGQGVKKREVKKKGMTVRNGDARGSRMPIRRSFISEGKERAPKTKRALGEKYIFFFERGTEFIKERGKEGGTKQLERSATLKEWENHSR